ncbi:MAG: MerR family transcriptional regulator [Pseudomonadota bacterium]
MSKSSQAFRTIREVSDWLDVKAHVLRFWESKFPQIKPVKRAGGRRYYRPGDMELVGGIKVLLHEQGMTIKGVQNLIRSEGTAHVAALSPPIDTLSFEEAPADELAAWDLDLNDDSTDGIDDAEILDAAPPDPVADIADSAIIEAQETIAGAVAADLPAAATEGARDADQSPVPELPLEPPLDVSPQDETDVSVAMDTTAASEDASLPVPEEAGESAEETTAVGADIQTDTGPEIPNDTGAAAHDTADPELDRPETIAEEPDQIGAPEQIAAFEGPGPASQDDAASGSGPDMPILMAAFAELTAALPARPTGAGPQLAPILDRCAALAARMAPVSR